MLEDVNHALKVFDVCAKDLPSALLEVAKLNDNFAQQSANEKTNYAFLQAFTRGYGLFCKSLGTVIKTTIIEFSDYVALEEKSCFVEWIDLYYDCPLTRKGITLVDTPGADSINARHTGVAFDFIKNSDAILFVTYYNHAFSKADREFLIQLGRVKDSFQLDKMFFIINAIDLANNEEEKEDVAQYVHTQLIKYGVRNPHLYSLSSLNALKEKQEKGLFSASGMQEFEDSFYHFIANDLANMATIASENELQRVYCLLEKLIENSQEDIAVKQQKQANIEVEKAEINAILLQQIVHQLKNHLDRETEELIYYIKQRVFLRFNDFFKEAFNPSVLRDDGRNMKKVLQKALEELLEQIGFDFAQEMRATTIRIDRFIEKMLVEYQDTVAEKICGINPDISCSIFTFEDSVNMEFESAFKEMDCDLFAKAMAYFKTPKTFFEKNESKLMSAEIYKILNESADVYLQTEQKRLQAVYDDVLEQAFKKLILHKKEEVDEFYLGLLSTFEGEVPVKQLMAVQQSLKQICK